MTKRIIGLTGGIATGKSTVANYLAKTYDLPIFDADIYSREAVTLGSPILQKISQRYGKEILLENGELNRPKLGKIIFNNQEERLFIESLIHPYVRDKFIQEIAASSKYIVVLVVPLLFEAEMTELVTEIWVVWCSPEKQLERLMQRNNLSNSEAQERINSQMPLSEKAALADVVLDNSTNEDALFKQVDKLIYRIL
ncbi:MAG: dephospho-CoA kinase [Scytonematopsis contorta HA4267-MV1]|jgi:dephospho-CoA kinase|nr:dephospho-CoA kinase [Scytonematopsis contorta HA4267-MV1]